MHVSCMCTNILDTVWRKKDSCTHTWHMPGDFSSGRRSSTILCIMTTAYGSLVLLLSCAQFYSPTVGLQFLLKSWRHWTQLFTSSIFILIGTASCYAFSGDKLHHVIFELQYQIFCQFPSFGTIQWCQVDHSHSWVMHSNTLICI